MLFPRRALLLPLFVAPLFLPLLRAADNSADPALARALDQLERLIQAAPPPGTTNFFALPQPIAPEHKVRLFQDDIPRLTVQSRPPLLDALLRYQAAWPDPQFPQSALALGDAYWNQPDPFLRAFKKRPLPEQVQLYPFLAFGWDHRIADLSRVNPKVKSRSRQLDELHKSILRAQGKHAPDPVAAGVKRRQKQNAGEAVESISGSPARFK